MAEECEYMMSKICCLIIETGECQFCLPFNQIHVYYVLNTYLVWKITSIKDYEKMTKYLSHLLQFCLEQRWPLTSTDDQRFLLLSSCILLNFFQKRHLCIVWWSWTSNRIRKHFVWWCFIVESCRDLRIRFYFDREFIWMMKVHTSLWLLAFVT